METVALALRVALSLGVVLALLWVLQKRVARGRGGLLGTRRASTVTVVARQGVGAKASVVVVDVEGERLVLGVTDGGISVLSSAEAPQAAPEPAPLTPVARLVPAEPRGEAFAQVLAEQAQPAPAGAVEALPLRPRGAARRTTGGVAGTPSDGAVPARRAPGRTAQALDGSILSPETWRQAATVLRSRRLG
ncbi:FliO/MopB family protein [Frigoribacterium salinisoli]